ncbi:hypothetical protein [Aestuariivivens insulae]|uniref:hypothetical protein n=1 Tax=Aestuariivivens insulae TaxID=1621988 RepID=UPI001F5958F4|nr:hypothetical protein [Aestuariivivens insulae]
MERRDLLKAQVEQLGKVLAKILADFLKLPKGDSRGVELTNQRFQNELDIDIEKLKALTKEETEDYLRSLNLTADHLEILSEYIKEIGLTKIEEDKVAAKVWLKKAIDILDFADKISKTVSFIRINKKAVIDSILQQQA